MLQLETNSINFFTPIVIFPRTVMPSKFSCPSVARAGCLAREQATGRAPKTSRDTTGIRVPRATSEGGI